MTLPANKTEFDCCECGIRVIGCDQFRVNVVLYQEDGIWIAQGIQFDITARGRTPTEASERFNDKFGAELVMSIEVGDETPLAGVAVAPKEFWEMLPANKTEFDCCECGIRVIGCVPSPIHPYCALCVWVPGWWRSAELRDRLAHDERNNNRRSCPSDPAEDFKRGT